MENENRLGVVGASGFLGSYLLPKLAHVSTTPVQALTRTLPSPPLPTHENIQWMQGDLSSSYDCAAFLERVDAIVHLAHSGSPFTSDADLPADARANLIPLVTLVQEIRHRDSPVHLVYASSGGAIYGIAHGGKPWRESDQCLPTTSYGIQKLAAEHYLRLAAERGWLTAVTLRIGNAYGVVLPAERLQGLIGVAFAHLVRDEPIRLFGNPENVRDYVHLDDIFTAVDIALRRRERFEIFNIGSGVGHSVREVIRLIGAVASRNLEMQALPLEGDALPAWVVLDISRARNHLGWNPDVSLEDGLCRMARAILA
jgi:UDP-glucose 4-epimerase